MEGRKPATIKDIAKVLNISTSTVSRALRDLPEVSKKTRDQVKKLAKEMEYQPNIVALSLVKQRSNNIGVVIPEIVQPFYASAISGIEDVAVEAGYNVMICQSKEKEEREQAVVKALVASRVAGLIICSASSVESPTHIEHAYSQGMPLVQLDRVWDSIPSSKVVADDQHGAFLAVEHLIKQGYRRIAHLGGPSHMSISQNRRAGYIEALKQYGLPVDEGLILPTTLAPGPVRQCVEKMLEMSPRPDAIFAVNDPSAVEALQVIRESGINVPSEIGLAGFDNQPITSYLSPGITTIEQPSFQMGQLAMNLLLEEVSNDKFQPRTEIMKTSLVARASSSYSANPIPSVSQ